MNNRIDKLFEGKLSQHAIEPDAKAWSRVAANLPKKNNGIIWFRAAAGIAIAGLALMLWFYSGMDSAIDNKIAQDASDINAKNEEVTNDEAAKTKEILKSKEEFNPTKNQQQPPQIAAQHNTRKRSIDKKTETDEPDTKAEMKLEEHTKAVAQLELEETKMEHVENIDLTTSIINKTEANKPIVIVFELPEVTKKKDPLDLDLTPQKKSGIKRVLEIANDVRTGESPIAGLRQAKEEIFALNFKKEDKNNNK